MWAVTSFHVACNTTCCTWQALDVLHVIYTRLRPGHLSVRVGDCSQRSEEIVKNLGLCLWMRFFFFIFFFFIIIFFFFFFFFFFFLVPWLSSLSSGCINCSATCLVYRLSWCQFCSSISSGAPTTLSSVLVSWYIICSDVPSARSIICPGVLLVYHLFWCPVCSIYYLSWCPSCISSVLMSRLLDLSSVLVSFGYN